jgi:hypothetical protein
MLSLFDITTDFRIVAIFVIVVAQTQFLTKYVGLFMASVKAESSSPRSSDSSHAVRAMRVASAEALGDSAKENMKFCCLRHEGDWGSRGIAPLFLNLGTGWR